MKEERKKALRVLPLQHMESDVALRSMKINIKMSLLVLTDKNIPNYFKESTSS